MTSLVIPAQLKPADGRFGSGPDMAPMAPDIAAATSAPVEAMTRPVKVEAFMPCSAAVLPSSTRLCGTAGRPSPRADWATNDSAVAVSRARLSRVS